MTTVVAIETTEGVILAHDSRASDGHGYYEIEQPKIVVNNGITYGVAGAIHALNLVTHGQLPAYGGDASADAWVTTTLTPALIELLADLKDDDGWAIQILAVVDGRVYDFGSDMGWTRYTDGVYTIGSGASYARGALSAGADPETAVRIAARHDQGTAEPVRRVDVPKHERADRP